MRRWLGLLALLPLLVGGVAGGSWAWTQARLLPRALAPVAAPAPADPERGQHLFVLAKCGVCHGADLGGGTMMDEPLLGRIHGPNLTTGRGGIGGARTDADLVRALRHGLAPDGRPLVAMPTAEHARFSAPELAAILAALRALPPVDREVAPTRVGLGLAVLYAFGQIELVGADLVDPAAPIPPEVPVAPTLAFGEHLAHVGSCVSCHGEALAGGPMAGAPPDWPPAANLTPHADGLAGWTREDFTRSMREGLRPDGTVIDPRMPWAYTAWMTDVELEALWRYLTSLPPAPDPG